MYFIFEMEFSSNRDYLTKILKAYATNFKTNIEDEVLPASIFLGKSRHYFLDTKPQLSPIKEVNIPINISLCPTCQKEMFDVSSPRYYYPFTSCSSCGYNHIFVTSYPYIRDHTTMKFLRPCKSCQDEKRDNPLKRDHHLISCIECGISMKINDGKSQRYANDKGSYRKLFEVSARAIAKGKRVLMKTGNGYRNFFKPKLDMPHSDMILLLTDVKLLNTHLMMVTQEFNALLSIERPILRVSTKSDEMKSLFGSTLLVKYPDDGITMLLARELINEGLGYVVYEESDSDSKADLLVDFDIPINPQRDSKLFINQDMKFFVSGERVVFPTIVNEDRDIVSIAHNLVALRGESGILIDSMDHFESMETERLNILEGEEFESSHSNKKIFEEYRASMLSILAQHNTLGKKAIGIHFDSSLYFLYYNGREVINVVPPNPFDIDDIFEHISKLRDGSDRLVANYKDHHPKIVKEIKALSGECDIFVVTATILGLKDRSLEGISAEALSFLGKGGIQIDTHIEDNRFDNHAFLASIMSYQLAGVESELICYSIYESFGDYISEIISQLMEKTKASTITLSGETIANQALYARIDRHLGRKDLLFPREYPIGRESSVYGGIYL